MMRIGRYGYMLEVALVFWIIFGGAIVYQYVRASAELETQEINSLKAELEDKLKRLDTDNSPASEKARIAYEAHAISIKLASKGYVDTNTLDAAIKAELYRAKPSKDIATDLKNFSNIGMSKEMSDNLRKMIESFRKE